jgi:hypothetical protein
MSWPYGIEVNDFEYGEDENDSPNEGELQKDFPVLPDDVEDIGEASVIQFIEEVVMDACNNKWEWEY